MRPSALVLILAATSFGEVHEFPGGKEVPHAPYIRVVSETASPVERVYIKADDGLYIAAAIRKPPGEGPFPAFIQFHGAPGGQGMDSVVRWARGEDGGPMWERYLQEGFAVVVSDYRGGHRPSPADGPDPEDAVTRFDDGVAVVEHVKGLPYVDPERIAVYGGSLGGDLVLQVISRTKVQAAGVGAPAAFWFLGVDRAAGDRSQPDYWQKAKPNPELARKRIAAIECPLLIQVGGADGLVPLSRWVHDLMEEAGKPVRLEIYANSPHGFYFNPLRTPPPRPLLDSSLAALDSSVAFMKRHTRP